MITNFSLSNNSMHILQITLSNTFTTTTIISHTTVSLLMYSFTKSQVWKIFLWLHFSHDKPSWSVQLLTPSSLLFMILMATFSPVRMCRPSLTLAKPPENTSHLVGERAKPWDGGECWRGLDSTRTDGLINLVVFVELFGTMDLCPLHRHPFYTFPRRE